MRTRAHHDKSAPNTNRGSEDLSRVESLHEVAHWPFGDHVAHVEQCGKEGEIRAFEVVVAEQSENSGVAQAGLCAVRDSFKAL